MITRNVVLFLIANFIGSIFLIFHFRNKVDSTPASLHTAQESTQEVTKGAITKEIIHKNNQNNIMMKEPSIKESVVKESTVKDSTNKQNMANAPICMEYGPLDIQQKSIVANLITKENVSAQVNIKKQYEVFWNLGQNEEQAKEMFAKQKLGVLQDNKFQLTRSEGMWIVSITTVNDSIETAKELAATLREKAGKVNAGGRWQYRTMPDAYYYHVENINQFSPSSLDQITKGMGIHKSPCSIG